MKKLSRLFFGLVTSLLLSAGFVRAAEHSAGDLMVKSSQQSEAAAPGCVFPCNWL